MALDESHQRFLQVIMSHGILEYSAAKTLHKHCCEVHKANYVDKLDDFVGVINKHLQPVFMQIRKGTDENNEKTYYALMDLIVDSDNGFASSTNILNLTDQLQTKKIKKKEVEQLLQRFVQDKWLIEKDGEYSLHARCVMEMEHYIKNTYQDIVKTCNICHNIAIQGQICENCGIKIHLTCVAKYFKGKPEPQCPQCTEQWRHEIPRLSQTDSQMSPASQMSSARENRKVAPPRSRR
ncbi:non-structural maintenance of chromosomes element 1 homolog isoform X3 [Hyperolius riggenbachi]|uniref:non-structural maintenance of chromosomes element 1 homolog isoform X3 n=1 Tax=Hyperolius riggenbachi TaxID=752182 RepID=UPI0035A29FBE